MAASRRESAAREISTGGATGFIQGFIKQKHYDNN
jgi:hypothetical protein